MHPQLQEKEILLKPPNKKGKRDREKENGGLLYMLLETEQVKL